MLFWKVRTEPFAEAKNARKSIPIFLTMLLAALLFYGFSEGTYFLYTQLFNFIQNQIALYKIDAELSIFYDFGFIIRSSAMIILVLFASLYVRFLEGRRLSTMGFHKEGLWSNLLKGAVIGVVLFGAMLGMLTFSGDYLFEGELRDDILSRLAGILSIVISGFSFEYFFRGFVLSSLGARSRTLTAVLLTAVLSTVAQSYYWGYSVISVFNNFLFNILLGLLVVRTGSAYTACAARTLFLFVCQFVFGTPYSGVAYAHAFVPTTVNYTSLWAGTSNGIDNGYTFTVIMAIFVLAAVFFPKKPPEEELESGPFFKHVPVEKKSTVENAESSETGSGAEDTFHKKEVTAAPVQENSSEHAESSAQTENTTVSEEDDEEWEEEEVRIHVDPDYKNPEDYLK